MKLVKIIIVLILISCIFLFSYFYHSNKSSFIEPDPITGKYDMEEIQRKTIIPLHIYQTWHTKDLPPKMRECVNKLKKANPEFEHHLYDDNDCREFIRINFDSNVLNAFDRLISGAYKADLWRYCVLYKNGGIYLDIKYEPVDGFKFIELVDNEYFVLEKPYYNMNLSLENELKLINSPNYYQTVYNKIDDELWKNKQLGIYNGFMICKANNPILFECIQTIVINVKNKYYGYNRLYPTGPGLLGEKYFKRDMSKIKEFKIFYSMNDISIITKKNRILKIYGKYREEQKKYGKNKNYGDLWNENNIYV